MCAELIGERSCTGQELSIKVRRILQKGPSTSLGAFTTSHLRIHGLGHGGKLSKTDQLKAFHELEEGLSMRKGARKTNKTGIHPSPYDFADSAVIGTLRDLRHPGHVLVRRSECPGTVISVGT